MSILGRWVVHKTDNRALTDLGNVALNFGEDGQLVYIIRGEAEDEVVNLRLSRGGQSVPPKGGLAALPQEGWLGDCTTARRRYYRDGRRAFRRRDCCRCSGRLPGSFRNSTENVTHADGSASFCPGNGPAHGNNLRNRRCPLISASSPSNGIQLAKPWRYTVTLRALSTCLSPQVY